jgi:hypothetical protein
MAAAFESGATAGIELRRRAFSEAGASTKEADRPRRGRRDFCPRWDTKRAVRRGRPGMAAANRGGATAGIGLRRRAFSQAGASTKAADRLRRGRRDFCRRSDTKRAAAGRADATAGSAEAARLQSSRGINGGGTAASGRKRDFCRRCDTKRAVRPGETWNGGSEQGGATAGIGLSRRAFGEAGASTKAADALKTQAMEDQRVG